MLGSFQVMREDEPQNADDVLLLDLDQDRNNHGNNLGGNGGGGLPQPAGFVGFPQPPMLPSSSDFQPFNYPVS